MVIFAEGKDILENFDDRVYTHRTFIEPISAAPLLTECAGCREIEHVFRSVKSLNKGSFCTASSSNDLTAAIVGSALQ